MTLPTHSKDCSSEMVVAVALAIKDALGKAMNAKPLLGDASTGDWYAEDAGSINLEVVARAAIQAMRDHTIVMRDAEGVIHELRGAPDDIWKTILREALK